MKKINYLIIILFTGLVLISCEKDESKVIYEGNPIGAVINSPSQNSSIVITENNLSSGILVIKWERANFGFPASATYTVQVDTLNSDYKRTKGTVIYTSSSQDSAVVKFKDLSAKLTKPLNVAKNKETTVEFRIRTILEKVDTVYSNPLTLKVTLQ